MAFTRVSFDATYTSGTGTNLYRFTITVNVAGVIAVRDIRTPYGLLIDSMTSVPEPVVDDINAAIAQVRSLIDMTSAINGTLTFIPVRVINKTITGFTIQVGITFTGTVGYDVFV